MSDQALTIIERVVIALAQRDPPSSLVPRRHIVRQIFGDGTCPALAAPRLEALRRYAILRRVHGTALARLERDQLLAAGFDDLQLSKIDRLICTQNHNQVTSCDCGSSHDDQAARGVAVKSATVSSRA